MATTITPAPPVKQWTLADVARGGGPPGLWEIIEGELREVSPAGGKHGRIGSAVNGMVWNYGRQSKIGVAYGPDTGFILRPDPLLLRVPDVAFVRSDRLPTDFDDGGYLRVVPDLVVEVISPSDSSLDVVAKVMMWLEHGTRAVWVIDPDQVTVTVYAVDAPPLVLTKDDTLSGGEILPGFAVVVSDIFVLPQ